MAVKQVIVVNRGTDPPMRRGKECAQAAHASRAFLTRRLSLLHGGLYSLDMTKAQREWLETGMRTVVVAVGSRDEMLAVDVAARAAGLETHRQLDAGHTEVEPGTWTALAVGPDDESKFETVTDQLPLY